MGSINFKKMLSSRVCLPQILSKLTKQRALVRADFNVPMKDGLITNNKRIVETIPTLKAILEQGPAGMTIMSHSGRPDGKPNQKFSLRPVAVELEKQLGTKVHFIDDCIGAEALDRTRALNNGEV